MESKTQKNGDMPHILHKVNNLLASSSLSAEMLLRGLSGELNEDQKNYLKNIVSDLKDIKEWLKKLN